MVKWLNFAKYQLILWNIPIFGLFYTEDSKFSGYFTKYPKFSEYSTDKMLEL